jgi:hypothetical protein
MERYLVEVKGKFYFETSQDPENIPGDIYSCISECFRSDEDIIDIEIQTFSIPKDGSSD